MSLMGRSLRPCHDTTTALHPRSEGKTAYISVILGKARCERFAAMR